MVALVTNSVVDSIRSVATDTRVALAMLMGAKLESNWNPTAVGDNGNSHGIFQINLPFHPSMSKATAQDPVAAARYMLPRYQDGVNKVSPALWNSDPAMAAATAAFYAERPARMYDSGRIRDVWPSVQSAATGDYTGVDSLTGLPNLNPADTFNIIIEDIKNFFRDMMGEGVNRIYFAMLYGAGFLMIGVGLYLLWKDSGKVANVATTTARAFLYPVRKVRQVTK